MESGYTILKILGSVAIWYLGSWIVMLLTPTSFRPYKGHDARNKAVVIWALICIVGGIIWILN